MKHKQLLFLVVLFGALLVGCKDNNEKFGPLKFQYQEKVCYIDDPNLIGRVLGRNGFGEYWVQWRSPSSCVGLFGGAVSTSPFTTRTHNTWELKSLDN
jgi:hypothetical protein